LIERASKQQERKHRAGQCGFTLLEAMVATLIMAIAVVGLLSNVSTSLSTASRLADYDQATLLAHRQMEQLLTMPLVAGEAYGGTYPRSDTSELEAGWQAVVEPFEASASGGGNAVLDRIVLEVWWIRNNQRHTLQLETLRALRPPNTEALSRYPRG